MTSKGYVVGFLTEINFSNSQYINLLLFWALGLNLFIPVFVPLF